MKPLKIVIVTQNIYPKLSPRAHRSSQLAFGLADAGHDVTVYALLGNSFDYKVYQKNRNIILLKKMDYVVFNKLL